MEEKIDLVILRSKLPHGYSRILKIRIKKKKKKDYALHTIRRGLTDKYANAIIIEEALLLASELDDIRKEQIKKVKSLQ